MNPILQRRLARLLIAAGAAALLWAAVTLGMTAYDRRQYEATLRSLRLTPGDGRVAPASLAVGEPIGTLQILRVGLSGIVVEGDDDSVLDRAIGHLPDTPLPWHSGNSALAAHRDALFRPLRDVRSGDVLRLETPHGDFDYRVRETLIVKPEDLWVLDATAVPMLTLISCYPFDFIGHAPERFIVRAERIPTGYRPARSRPS